FSNAVTELFLGGYPGFYTTTPPGSESAYGVYWPTLIPAEAATALVTFDDGSEHRVPSLPGDADAAAVRPIPAATPPAPADAVRETAQLPLGTVVGARSGDKGGNANLGLWTRHDDEYA